MKAGILTFHRAVNYGAVLQAYALQKQIELLGHEADIIDYRCAFIEEEVSPFYGFRKKHDLVSSCKQMMFRMRKNIAFGQFMKKYMQLSRVYHSKDDLCELNAQYDRFITGSDQVWNYGCSGNDKAFFLDFVSDKKKKNSYAASFGFEKISKVDPFCYEELLAGYHKMSVREKSAADIVNSQIGCMPEVTLDPTLLLKQDEWKKLVLKRPCKEKYIFVYFIREPLHLLKYVDKLAQKTGCKVINAKKSMEFLAKCSPQDFLTWFYHAEYVVTNSFHGTVFSIMFEKQFVVELDNGKSVNNRSAELLKLLEVGNRELQIDEIDRINERIDYQHVKNRLAEERKKSISFISQIME